MRAKHIVFLLALAGLAVAFRLGVDFYRWTCTPLFDISPVNKKKGESWSPSKKYHAVVFERCVSAMEDFSTQLAILPSEADLTNDTQPFFVSDCNHGMAPHSKAGGPEVKLEWIGDNELILTHHPKARIFRAEPSAGKVRITYRTSEVTPLE